MNVDLNKNFPLEHSLDSAWHLLSDVEVVAGCMPGAQITEVVDENNYKGTVRVKLGPVNMAFSGDIVVQSVDVEKKQIHLICDGKDNKGTSSATMDLTATVADGDDTASALLGDAKVIVNGKLASFGQRMMAQVSDQILEQFADNFRKQLVARSTGSETDAENADTPIEGGNHDVTNEDGPEDELTKSQANQSNISTAPDSTGGGNEINGFKFALTAIIGLITGLFKRK